VHLDKVVKNKVKGPESKLVQIEREYQAMLKDEKKVAKVLRNSKRVI
jgi:hypothetical protein